MCWGCMWTRWAIRCKALIDVQIFFLLKNWCRLFFLFEIITTMISIAKKIKKDNNNYFSHPPTAIGPRESCVGLPSFFFLVETRLSSQPHTSLLSSKPNFSSLLVGANFFFFCAIFAHPTWIPLPPAPSHLSPFSLINLVLWLCIFLSTTPEATCFDGGFFCFELSWNN